MKFMTLSITGILVSATLTSCLQEKTPPADTGTVQIDRAVKTTNIIYLDNEVKRGNQQDAALIYNDIIKQGNVVVDFYADWCSPCKAMGNTIEKVARQFPSITFLKIDTDKFRSIGSDVQGIPTLIFFKNGQQLTRFTGARDKNTFIAMLNQWYLG